MKSPIRHVRTSPGRTVLLDGAEYLFFSGTGYLGMHCNAALGELLREGTEKYGLVYGSSRLSNLQLDIYARAEEHLAGWLGTESCTVVSSGFMAGRLVGEALRADGWHLLYAPGAHPALRSGGAASPAVTWDEWMDGLAAELEQRSGRLAILASSLDPLYSVRYDFSFAGRLPRNKELLLVIDDSHGLGVLGPGGEGILASLPADLPVELIILGSLGKALGIPAGAVWSTRARAELLRHTPVFIGASPPAPGGLYACLEAGQLYDRGRGLLTKNIALFSQLTTTLKQVRQASGLPVFFLEDDEVAAWLYRQGVLISSFPYPEADSPAVNRIVLSALHSRADLERLAGLLKDYFTD